MPRFFTLLLSLFFFAKTSFAQTTYTWIGGAVGDYQDANNWSPVRLTPAITDVLAFDVTTPVSVANVPNQTIGAVRILSGTSSVTFGTNLVTNVLSINAATPLVYTTGGSIIVGDLLTVSLTNTAAFNINSGAFGIAPSTGGKVSIFSDLILDGGKLDFDVAGTGGAVIESGGSITYTSGIFLSANEGSVVWRANSNYYHNISGASASAIPVSLWETNATCSITGMNAGAVIAPTGFTNVIFYNLVWNCTAQTANADLDFLGNSVTINGSLTINSTGSGAVRFSGLSNTITVSKQYTQTNGTLVLQTGSSDRILLVKDVFNHTGGSIDFVGGSGSGSATVNVAANLTKGPSSVWSSTSTDPASKMKLQFSGVLPLQTVDIAGTWNAPNQGTCNIINTNTDQTGVIVTGTLQVINTNSVTAATCDN